MDSATESETCPICGGFGWVTYDVPVGHPQFGKAFPCECRKAELSESRHAQLLKFSNLAVYQEKTFTNFETDSPEWTGQQSAKLRVAVQRCFDFAQQPQGWLFLQGGYGCGKTHLAAAIGNHLLSQGQRVMFLTAPDLLDHLRSAYAPSAEMSYDALFDRVRDVSVLIVDDLGSESPTAWATEKLYQLFNYRYVNRLPTIITTNNPIDNIDARISSRLLDNAFTFTIHMDLPDYRRKEVQEKSELSNLQLYADMTFENFSLRQNGLSEELVDNLQRALQLAYQFAHDPTHWLVFLGNHGCGKTHLAAAIANYRQSQNQPVLWVNVTELADRLRETFYSQKVSFEKRFHEIRTVKLLILDHFKLPPKGHEWAQERLFQLLDYRYLAKLPTVITKFGDSIDDLPAEFRSRLADKRLCRLFVMRVPDYRGGIVATRPRE